MERYLAYLGIGKKEEEEKEETVFHKLSEAE
jgi:hypothetical protein